jgi:hypothetical protein
MHHPRIPKQKSKAIEIKWAKGRDDFQPDWYAGWGEGISTGAANKCLTTISQLAKELVAAGFDPASIKFVARKK